MIRLRRGGGGVQTSMKVATSSAAMALWTASSASPSSFPTFLMTCTLSSEPMPEEAPFFAWSSCAWNRKSELASSVHCVFIRCRSRPRLSCPSKWARPFSNRRMWEMATLHLAEKEGETGWESAQTQAKLTIDRYSQRNLLFLQFRMGLAPVVEAGSRG